MMTAHSYRVDLVRLDHAEATFQSEDHGAQLLMPLADWVAADRPGSVAVHVTDPSYMIPTSHDSQSGATS